MASSLLGWIPGAGLLAGTSPGKKLNIPSVEIHDVEALPDRRSRRLKHLLRANHINYSVLYHNLQFDNHLPHILSSAYLLGATSEQLNAIYEKDIAPLEPWTPSPAEVTQDDWRDFLGDKLYQRSYVDFFEDCLAMKFNYDWKKCVEHFMFSKEEPLAHGLICGRESATTFPHEDPGPLSLATDGFVSSGASPHTPSIRLRGQFSRGGHGSPHPHGRAVRLLSQVP